MSGGRFLRRLVHPRHTWILAASASSSSVVSSSDGFRCQTLRVLHRTGAVGETRLTQRGAAGRLRVASAGAEARQT